MVIEKDNQFAGYKVVRQMWKYLLLTTVIGVPVVIGFLLYIVGGSTSNFMANFADFLKITVVGMVVVFLFLAAHGLCIKLILSDAASFLDRIERGAKECESDYYGRISRALNCALSFPRKASNLSLLTWPLALCCAFLLYWLFFFKFPLVLSLFFVIGTFLAGVLVANFQFYFFKKGLLPVQKYMLSFYPSYWKDESLREVRQGLRAKMVMSLVSLMLLVACILALLNSIETGNALFYQWGKNQKSRILREVILLGLDQGLNNSPEQLEHLRSMLDDGSGASLYVFDKNGKNLMKGDIDDREEAIVGAVAAGNYKINPDFLIIPTPKDSDVSLNLQNDNIGVNARVEIPDSDIVVVARSFYIDHLGMLSKMIYGNMIIIIGTLLMSLIFAWVSSGDITEPVHEMAGVADRVSKGELVEQMDIVTHDELGLLAVSFKSMVDNLRKMIIKISGSASSVEEATFKIVEGFSSVSERSRKQTDVVDETGQLMEEMNSSIKSIGSRIESLAATSHQSGSSIMQMSATIKEVAESSNMLNMSVEQAASSISQMTAGIGQVAGNVESLNSKAEETINSVTRIEQSIKEVQTGTEQTAEMSGMVVSNAVEGKKQVQSTIEGVEQAKESSEQAVQAMRDLAEKASQINDIVTVINDVTDQTNLLALNAAIIAAQAGERGRGFGVVANQIKNLAEKTARSTGEIKSLILNVQQGAEEAVMAVQIGYEIINKNVDLSRKAGDSLDLIIESANRSAEHNQDIVKTTFELTDRTTEVFKFFEEITDSIGQLETATQEQFQGANQIMQSAEQMREITKRVKTATEEQYSGSQQIIDANQNINNIINYVNKSQGEQIENADRVAEAIREIREIASQNNTDAQRMFESSSSLASLAEELRDMVREFKT